MANNETINNENDKIKDYLVSESKSTCIVWEKHSFLHKKENGFLKTQA